MFIEMAVCLPKEAKTVGLVRAAIARTLDLFGVEDESIEDIRLAVSEACTNVIEHASSDDEYEVSVRVDETECSIRVRNTGNGFDAESLAGVMPGTGSARGRGVAIMRAVMDDFRFSSSHASGTIVHMVRTLRYREGAPLLGNSS